MRRDYYLAEIVDAERLLIRGQSRHHGRGSAAVSTATALDSGAREPFMLTPGARAWVYQDLRKPECWYLQGWFG